MNLKEFRDQNQQFKDMSDNDLSDAIYNTYYSDMPRAEFNKHIGYEPVGAAKDLAKTVIPSLGRGVTNTLAIPNSLAALAEAGADYIGENPFTNAVKSRAKAIQDWTPSAEGPFAKGVHAYTGDYKPQTTVGRYGGAALEALPSMVLPAGQLGLGAKAALALFSGVGSEAGGDIAENVGAPRWTGNIAGGVGAAYSLPKLTKAANVATGNLAKVQELERPITINGVQQPGMSTVSAGQYTGNPFLLQREANLMNKKQATKEAGDYTRAVGARGGMPDQKLDLAAMNRGQAIRDIDQLTLRHNDLSVPGFTDLQRNLRPVRAQAFRALDPAEMAPIDTAINNMRRTPAGLNLTGDRYMKVRSDLGKSIGEAERDSPQHTAYTDVRNQLTNAMQAEHPGTIPMHNMQEAYDTLRAAWKPGTSEQVDPAKLGKLIQGRPEHPLAPVADAGSILARPEATEPGRISRMLGAGLGYFGDKLIHPGEQAAGGIDRYVPSILMREVLPDVVSTLSRNPATRAAYFNPVTQSYLKHGVPGLNRVFTDEISKKNAMVRALANPNIPALAAPDATSVPAVTTPYPIQ